MPKSMDISKGSSKREVYSNSGLPQEIRKTSNKQSNLTPEGTRKTRPNKMQSQQKEVTNIKVEINEIETKKYNKRTMKLRFFSLNGK